MFVINNLLVTKVLVNYYLKKVLFGSYWVYNNGLISKKKKRHCNSSAPNL